MAFLLLAGHMVQEFHRQVSVTYNYRTLSEYPSLQISPLPANSRPTKLVRAISPGKMASWWHKTTKL